LLARNEKAPLINCIAFDTALRLRIYFGLPAQFWLNLQNEFDLRRAASPALKRVAPRAA
jgi:antitoxin HigA-1